MFLRICVLLSFIFFINEYAYSHCQMPCGIYHDDMVYDQIDQYVETMYKAMWELNELKLDTPKERNQFVRWVMQKDKNSDEAAELLCYYFLEQKIKPDEPDTLKRLVSLHKLLFLTVQIKQNVDIEIVKQFKKEWDDFKLMFHREGYKCEMEKKEFEKLDQLRKQKEKEKQKPKEK